MRSIRALINLIRREPARSTAIFKALLTIALAFGLHITAGQQDALLLLALVILGSGETTRSMVTPVIKEQPPLGDG